MGNGPSIKSPVEEFVENTPTGEGDEPPNLKQSETEILRLMFPLYYTEELLTDAELESATNCWSLILSNRAPGFVSVKKDPNCSYPTSIAYFYNVFYKRLFDINPMSRDLFKDVNTQGKFLVKMLSLSLSEKRDPEKYEQTLRKLAEVHNERGIKAIECKSHCQCEED